MKKFTAVVVTLFTAILSLALVARGQAPAGAPGAVVVPPVFPEFLPLGDEWMMKDWAVTNRQFRMGGNPYNVSTIWSVDYTESDGSTSSMGASSSGYLFLDWDDFMKVSQKIGLDLLRRVRATNTFNKTKTMTFSVVHGYDNIVARKGVNAVYIRKNIGLIENIKPESFLDETGLILLQGVVRVDLRYPPTVGTLGTVDLFKITSPLRCRTLNPEILSGTGLLLGVRLKSTHRLETSCLHL